MRKIKNILFLIIPLMVLFTSCSDDDDNEVIVSNEALAGTVWQGTFVKPESGESGEATVIFIDDKKWTFNCHGKGFAIHPSIYKAKNNVIFGEMIFIVKKFTKNTLILEREVGHSSTYHLEKFRMDLKRDR